MYPYNKSQPVNPRGLTELTPREREVLILLAQGLTDLGIGQALWLTRKTVETHIRHILNKLGLPNDRRHHRRVLAAMIYQQAQDQERDFNRAAS